ncbi:MAG: bifunctional ADP-dependent NAD(P)H-hydrate dehydratase/NAD(P)H-hydrate epimerase, partial [Bacteroidetes bacterium HGW-Bacteroidetes-21]
MKIFSVKQIANIDKFTIDNEPISSVDLMERAANAFFEWINSNLNFTSYTIFAGPGNNGGDGLVIARLLYESGKKVNVYLYHPRKISDDCNVNYERIQRKKP